VDLLPLSGPGPLGRACSREEAVARLRGRGPAAWYRRWRHGPLCDARGVQVPYRLFEVRVCNAGHVRRQWMAIDAVTGALDPYGFAEPPAAEELGRRLDADALPVVVPPQRQQAAVLERVRRQVYAAGFFQLRNLRIKVDDTGRVLYLPYWVGFHRKRGDVWMEVLGGLRRSREGAKMRELLAPWLASSSSVIRTR
jgi:hypothetical protein